MAHILIFEDDTRLSAHWKNLLEESGHTARCCSTIKEAMMLVEQATPDLVIADMLIRQGNTFVPEGGLTLLAKLKLMDQNFSAPIIGVSGMKKGPFIKATPLEIASQMGIDVALYKPISANQLLNTVELLLGNPSTDKVSKRVKV